MTVISVGSTNDRKFYIDGAWVEPIESHAWDVTDPATGRVAGTVTLGGKADIDKAVASARRAFPAFSATTPAERSALLQRIIDGMKARRTDLVNAMTAEMGTPITFSNDVQFTMGMAHFEEMVKALADYEWESMVGRTQIRREAIGVCGLITPWNWPLNQVTCKLAPALAAGCTVVLKPSEMSPLSTIVLTEILHDAGVPKGVFNLVNGDGPGVGEAISRHPDIDMVSFTGSTRAGILIAKAAADTVKRVTQELGGKSPNIVLEDADIDKAVTQGVTSCFRNSGQSCQAPTRMLVHRSKRDAAIAAAKKAVDAVVLGDPFDPKTTMGPVVNEPQWKKVQGLIESGVSEGATLVVGGPGRPEGFPDGFYVKPTVFADVKPSMAISREEIFGPVLSIVFYDTEEEAIHIANDTPYGLAGYVQSGDIAHARKVANQIRAGRVYINNAPSDRDVPFGGYKQSGNGREMGVYGLEEYLETKAVLGFDAP